MTHAIYLDVPDRDGKTLDPIKVTGFATESIAALSAKLMKDRSISDVRKFASDMGAKIEMKHGRLGTVRHAEVA